MAIAIETFLNPAKFAEELTSKLKDYRLPGIEVDAVMAGQRKNVEALTNASRAAFEGAQALAKRQAEILQETLNQTADSFRMLAEAGSPPEVAAKQAELAKEAFEKALGNMRELAEMVTKSQQGAMDAISGRISQSLDEIKDMALKMKEPYATKKQPTAEETQLSAKEKQQSAKQKQPSSESGTG
jgi:phasin family protein